MVKIHLHPQGTRVRVRRGERFPIDPSMIGRTGTVLHLRRGRGDRYGVQLDGEVEVRVFAEDELEALETAGSLEETGAHQGGNASDAAG